MSWLTTTMGKVCLPTSQRDPTRNGTGSFRYIDISGIDREAKIIIRADSVPCAEAPSRARKLVQAGDVLVSTVRPNLNAVAMVPEELNGEIASTGFCVLRANPDLAMPRYLFYRAQHQEFVDFLVANATGASYPAVTDGVVRRVPLPLPPLPEQARIVELLDDAERLRRLRRQADSKAARVLPALFLKMFGDPVTNPMGWPTGTLRDFGTKVRYGLGQPPKQSHSGLPLIRATNIHAGTITEKNLVFVNPADVPVSRNALLDAREVIVVRSGAYTGDAAQVTEKWAGSVVGYDLVVTPPDGWTGEFIEQLLLTPFVQRNYFESQKGRAGQPHLNSSQLETTPAFHPNEKQQQLFASRVGEIRRNRVTCEKSAENLDQVFALLLVRSFYGQLTAKWREAHMKELLAEMEQQATLLNVPLPKELEAAQ